MKFQKGNKASPGRTKGVQNKNTKEVRESFKLLIESNLEQLQLDIKSLDPKDRITAILGLANYVLPKLQSIELDTTVTANQNFIESMQNLNDSQVEAILIANADG